MIPESRFNSFCSSWNEMKVGDVCDVITDFVAAGSFEDIRKNVEYLRDNGYAQLVRTKDIKNKFSSDDSVFISRASYEYLWRVHLDKPCVVLPNVGNCGEVYYLSPNLLPCEYNALGPNAILVRSIDQDNYFLSLVFETRAFQEQLKLITSPTGQKKFNKTDIKKIGIVLPGILEQQKIASFFSTLDEKISISERRLSCLKKLKKGVMQNIFSQKIRFKRENGINFEDWTLKTIGSIGQISTGSTPKTSNEEYFGGQYLWVTPTDILGKEISDTARTLTEAGMAVSRRIPANSILVTCIASIGKNCILRTTGSCNQQINSITPNEFFDPDFVYYSMCKNEQVLHANAGHGGMEILNKSDFSNIEILFPCKDEQKKISAYLTTLDDKIAIVEKRLLSLHLLKKSFMQQMFI